MEKRPYKEREYYAVEGPKFHKDTIPFHLRLQRDWVVALTHVAAQRTADEERLYPYTVAELIREAIAKTYFLRKGEHTRKFREGESSYGETKKYL